MAASQFPGKTNDQTPKFRRNSGYFYLIPSDLVGTQLHSRDCVEPAITQLVCKNLWG